MTIFVALQELSPLHVETLKAETLNKQQLESIGKKYHEIFQSVISKDPDKTLTNLAEISKTLEGVVLPVLDIFSTASLKQLSPDYKTATKYVTKMTTNRLESIRNRSEFLHKCIQKYLLLTDYYNMIHEPIYLMTEAQWNYSDDYNYTNFKEQCSLYQPGQVIFEMFTTLFDICKIPSRFRDKRIRKVREFFDLLQKTVKVKAELQKEWFTLRNKILNKVANNTREDFQWFTILQGKILHSSNDAQQIINFFNDALSSNRSDVSKTCLLSAFGINIKDSRIFRQFIELLTLKLYTVLQLALNCPVTKTDALQYVSYTSIIAQRLKSYMESEMETAWPDTAYEIAEKVVNQFADPKTGILDKEKFFLSAHEIREQVSWSGPDIYHYVIVLAEVQWHSDDSYRYMRTNCMSKKDYEKFSIAEAELWNHNCTFLKYKNVLIFFNRFEYSLLKKENEEKWTTAQKALEGILINTRPSESEIFNSTISEFMQNSVAVPYSKYLSFYCEYRWTNEPKLVLAISRERTLPLTFYADIDIYVENNYFYWDKSYRIFLFIK